MPIHDKVLEELVAKQTALFESGASVKEKEEVLKKIQKRQRELMKQKE